MTGQVPMGPASWLLSHSDSLLLKRSQPRRDPALTGAVKRAFEARRPCPTRAGTSWGRPSSKGWRPMSAGMPRRTEPLDPDAF